MKETNKQFALLISLVESVWPSTTAAALRRSRKKQIYSNMHIGYFCIALYLPLFYSVACIQYL